MGTNPKINETGVKKSLIEGANEGLTSRSHASWCKRCQPNHTDSYGHPSCVVCPAKLASEPAKHHLHHESMKKE